MWMTDHDIDIYVYSDAKTSLKTYVQSNINTKQNKTFKPPKLYAMPQSSKLFSDELRPEVWMKIQPTINPSEHTHASDVHFIQHIHTSHCKLNSPVKWYPVNPVNIQHTKDEIVSEKCSPCQNYTFSRILSDRLLAKHNWNSFMWIRLSVVPYIMCIPVPIANADANRLLYHSLAIDFILAVF